MNGNNAAVEWRSKLEKDEATRAKVFSRMQISIPLFWLIVFALCWGLIIYFVRFLQVELQQVDSTLLIALLASVTTATFAAGILNMPAYIALRHLSNEIQISRTALNKELHMQNAILLRQTTNMTLEEIQELMQEDDVKEEKKGPVKRGNVKRGNVKRGWKIWRPKWPTRKNKRTESASSTVPESAQISQNKTTDERN